MFDPRLQTKVLKLVDVSYGGENGFNQAIELSQECLANVKFIQEKKLIGEFRMKFRIYCLLDFLLRTVSFIFYLFVELEFIKINRLSLLICTIDTEV